MSTISGKVPGRVDLDNLTEFDSIQHMDQGSEQARINFRPVPPPVEIIDKVEKKDAHTPITDVAVSSIVQRTYTMLHEMYLQGNHGLMMLVGPEKQAGSTRIVTGAIIVPNDQTNTTMPVNDAVDWAREKLRTNPEYINQRLTVVGFGSVVGEEPNVITALHYGGVDLILAGGNKLQRIPLRTIPNSEQWHLYTRGDRPNSVQTPRVYQIASHTSVTK